MGPPPGIQGFCGQRKPFPPHGLAGGLNAAQLASAVVAEPLRVVYALPTKWSWGLSHPSPLGMVAMVSFPPWPKGQVIAGSVAAVLTDLLVMPHHSSLRSSPCFHREIEFLNPTEVALCRTGASTPSGGEGWQNFLLQHFPAAAFFTNSTNSPLWYLQVLTEMSINTECFSGTSSLCDPLLCFLHLFYINHLKIPVDDTAGQQRKYSYNLPWSSIQPLRQTTCSARDHPTPVQVYTFPAKIPWESGKAADDGWIHLCATTFPAAEDHVRNNLRGEQSTSLGKVEDMEINQGKITALQNSLHYAAMER